MAKAHADINNDCLRGYIVFPQFEHNSSAHFVDAGRLARRLGIVNIHSLYSPEELTSARAAAVLAAVAEEASQVAESRRREVTRSQERTPSIPRPDQGFVGVRPGPSA